MFKNKSIRIPQFFKNMYGNKNEEWMIHNGLNSFPESLNSPKATKVRTLMAFWSILKQRIFALSVKFIKI